MEIYFFNTLLFFIAYFNHYIFCFDNNNYYGTIIILDNKNNCKSYNITLHPLLNYPYLLKYNLSLFKFNNNTFINKINNEEFFMYFLDDEESIINLILNKTLDSLLSYNYLIVTSYNNNKNVFESLLYQALYINKDDYMSMMDFINQNDDKNNSNITIHLYYDNYNFLVPKKIYIGSVIWN